MGASDSKIINEIINNVSSKTQSRCSTDSSNLQTISITGLTVKGCKNVSISNVSQVANSSVNANCFNSNEFKTLLKDEIKNSTENLPSDNNLKKRMVNNTFIENLSSCMSSQSNVQKMNFDNMTFWCQPGGSLKIDQLSQMITSDLLSDCVQKNLVSTTETVVPSLGPSETTEPDEDAQDAESDDVGDEKLTTKDITLIIGLVALCIICILIMILTSTMSSSGKWVLFTFSLVIAIVAIIVSILTGVNKINV